MSREVVLIEGDGIGAEVVEAARRCLEATGADLRFEEAVMGQAAMEEHGTPLPEETVDRVREAGVALKGPVRTPVGSGFRSVNVELRKRLGLYANVRPCRFIEGVESPVRDPENIDLVIFRENMEDLYAGIEFGAGSDMHGFLEEAGFDTPNDSAYSVKPISRSGSERLIRRAFEYSEENGRDKVSVVDKANIMKETDGLFMEVGEEIAEDYDVEHEHVLVDNMAQQLVMNPGSYDVIATQNIYGDILSDLAAGLVGGVGVVPSANLGDGSAVFASVHGTAPDIAGEGVANPVAMIRSGALLLEHLGMEEESRGLETAVLETVKEGTVTPDLGGDASTEEVAEAVVSKLSG